jgi:hypothetical protein
MNVYKTCNFLNFKGMPVLDKEYIGFEEGTVI